MGVGVFKESIALFMMITANNSVFSTRLLAGRRRRNLPFIWQEAWQRRTAASAYRSREDCDIL
jgi:hypothetical protein